MGNPVVHFEVGAADDGPLVEFYGELFGWGLTGYPGGSYTMIDTRAGAGINGGIGKSQSGEPWSAFYVETDDPQATLDKAIALGGTTVMPVTDFGETVTFAMFSDPDGLLIGLVKSAADPSQSAELGPSAGSGEPVTWFEIVGSDPAQTQRFYADLFDWKVEGHPSYATADSGTGRGIQGGVGGGADVRWAIVYAGVPDLDQALDRVEKLGGSRASAPRLNELKNAARKALYGDAANTFKMGAFRDPAGNLFGLYSY